MKKVYVLSYNAGILGVFSNRIDAMREKAEYIRFDYKGVKVQEFNVR